MQIIAKFKCFTNIFSAINFGFVVLPKLTLNFRNLSAPLCKVLKFEEHDTF